VYDLGLTTEQFWALTPAQFAALSERHDARILHEERCHALAPWVISNMFRGQDQPAVPIETFIPHAPRPELEELSPEEEERRGEELFRRLMAAYPPSAPIRMPDD